MRTVPAAKAVWECLGISAENQDVNFASPPQGPQLHRNTGFPQWRWQNPNAGSASHHPEHKVWCSEDVVASLGRDDGKEPWSPVGLSRKGSRKALT